MRATVKAPDISTLRLFDSCVTLGRVVCSGLQRSVTADNVLAVMDKYDIAEALVHSNEARLVRPKSRGNERLLRQIEGLSRLHPVWVLEPPASPDPKAARRMVEDMLAAGVGAARLMMGAAPPLRWIWKDLCQALEAHRVPCLLDFAPLRSPSTQSTPDALMLDKLRDLCLAHPELPMILSHHSGGLGLSYAVLPLIRRVENLHIDVTSIVNYWRKVAAELGPHRVFFATGMPFYDPAILVSNVQYDEKLDVSAKRLICGDNLHRLMEAVR